MILTPKGKVISPKISERIPAQSCGSCGGKNAVQEVAKAKTAAEMDKAILDA